MLMDFTEGRLPERQRTEIESHLAQCEMCREQVSVWLEMAQGDTDLEALYQAPEKMIQRAVHRVADLMASPLQKAWRRTGRRLGKGIARLSRAATWPESEVVLVRSKTAMSEQLACRQLQFKDFGVMVEIERYSVDHALIRLIPSTNNSVSPPARVTLFKGQREVASMLLARAPVVFEDIVFGSYTLTFEQLAKAGEFSFQIKKAEE
jgi:hypothetical protein